MDEIPVVGGVCELCRLGLQLFIWLLGFVVMMMVSDCHVTIDVHVSVSWRHGY
jgi:hypothetical protein